MSLKSIYKKPKELTEVDFGSVELILKEYLDSNEITRTRLSAHTGIKFQTIDRYYKNKDVDRVDVVLLAKICYALDCKLSDILKYCPPKDL